MDRQKFRTLARLILILAATLVWAVYPGFGQNGNGNGNANGNGNGNGNGKNVGCKANQKNCTKEDKRWQAAINNADRRAGEIRKNNGKAKGHTK